MKGLLKWPLVIAAILVVLRVVLERSGVSETITNLLSVAVLSVFVFPMYCATQVVRHNVARPYATLFKNSALFAGLVRLMVIPTYWLAYIYQWDTFRFSVAGGGVVGEGMTPLMAYVGVPLLALVAWIVGAVVIGGGLGSAYIALRRRRGALRTA